MVTSAPSPYLSVLNFSSSGFTPSLNHASLYASNATRSERLGAGKTHAATQYAGHRQAFIAYLTETLDFGRREGCESSSPTAMRPADAAQCLFDR